MLENKDIKNSGFTLVETIVVIFVFTLLAMGTTTLFTHIFISSNDRLVSMDNIDRSNAVASNFVNELRVASFGSTGAFPIGQAGNTEIVLYSNYKQSPGVIARLHYYLASSTLYKGTTLPAGNPQSYNLAQESVRAVQADVANSGTPIFYYYDGNYNGSTTPLTQPINVNQIKYAKINLNILKRTTRTATSTFNIQAGAAVRNLKTNLGN